MLAVTVGGHIFAATAEGLLTSRDDGCAWAAHQDIGATNVRDIALEGDQRHVIALAQVPAGDHYDLVLYRSDENAERFAATRTAISGDLLGETLEAAPSNAARVYVTGTRFALEPLPADTPAVLLRSDDFGENWDRRGIAGTSQGDRAFIGAVDPTNPDRIYVRVRSGLSSQGFAQSFLLFSSDGGENWREVFRAPAEMLGFALAPDGQVLVGLGDAHDAAGNRPVDRSVLGLYRAQAPELVFSRTFDGQVGCLARGTQGLFLCSSTASTGFELGFAEDGSTVRGLFALGAIRGVVDCEPSASTCEFEWAESCGFLGSCSEGTERDAEAASDGARVTSAPTGCTIEHPPLGNGRFIAAVLGAGLALLLARRENDGSHRASRDR